MKRVASTTAKIPSPRKLNALSVAMCAGALHLLAGMFLASTASAQGDDELGGLIFEVAPIPPDATGPTGPVTGAGTGAANAGATNAGPALIPSADPATLQADIAAYRARIADTQANDTPYSNELREQFDALGVLLQQSGEHEDAILAFESAMHIDRVNGGLYTLEQIPIVEKIIASHEALGHADDVNNFHEYLYYIQQKSYDDGDPRLLAAKVEWADWNLESYMKDTALGQDSPAAVANGEEYVAVQDSRTGSFTYVPRMRYLSAMSDAALFGVMDPTLLQTYGVDAERLIDDRLQRARGLYEDVVEADAAEAEDASTGTEPVDVRSVQHKLASVAFAVKQQFEGIDMVDEPGSMYYRRTIQGYSPPAEVTRGYSRNRDTFETIAMELEQDPAATVLQKAQAWIDLGDWNIAFDSPQRAEDAYASAWALLNAAGMDAAAIAEVFMPELLVPAPGFAIHKYSREIYGIDPDASIDYKGHLDLTLDVNRFGDVSGMRIDSGYPDASQVLRSELLDYLREQKVRPAVVNGETVKREGVKLRYYYSY